MNKIGILGSGMVAQALAKGFMSNGFEVMLGTRSTSKLSEWQSESGGKVGSFAETAEFGDLIILAVKGNIAETVLNLAQAAN